MTKIFTLTFDPNERGLSNIDNMGFSEDFVSMYTNMFSTLMLNPVNVNGAMSDMESYYNYQIAQAQNLSSILNISVSTAINTLNSTEKTVIQLDMDGNEIVSTSQASFADDKIESKNILGSVEKISNGEFLIADSKNKRAIIVDLLTGRVKWEYVSDRYVIDAHLVPYDITPIKITAENLTPLQAVFVNKNQYIKWENNSANPIYIYSGTVESDSFDSSFNINNYGIDFKSNAIPYGDSYTFTFEKEGEYNWFSYPVINIGKIIVSNEKLSSNDNYLITESDGLESSYTSRVIKVNSYGNIIWSFGNGYLVNPRDARPNNNNNITIST